MSNIDLNTKLDYILEEMKMVYRNDNRPWVIGYSGGKDSTTVVQLAFMMLKQLSPIERHKDIYIVSSDTLIENPIVLGYLKENSKFINDGAKNLGLPLYSHMVHPEYSNSYWANIIGKGLPTPTSIRFRWCTDKLKIKPSNTFIEEKVKENGEVVVLLGVRKAESIARKVRIQNRQIEGYLLTPHVSLKNTYVYNPIVDLTTDDVWHTLLSNNGKNPWGTNNNTLFELYSGADGGECPFTVTNDKETPSCGNSRFGCWICTVVNEDKSLTGFVRNGEQWLQPLLDFRKWLISIRNKHEYRMQYRRDGNHYYRKIYLDKLPLLDNYYINEDHIYYTELDNEGYVDLRNSHSLEAEGKRYETTEKDKIYLDLLPLINETQIDPLKVESDENGSFVKFLGYGPFNFKARKLILEKLLETQKLINEEYDYKKPILDKVALSEMSKLCDKHNIEEDLINKLLIETNRYKHFTNKSILDKSISKVLNQKYLHRTIVEEIKNDNK